MADDHLVAHHFDDLEQQHEAARVGMWVFLATEVLFFGGLFATYAMYRLAYPGAFVAGSHELSTTIGGVNTLVLLASSLTIVLAHLSAKMGDRAGQVRYLLATLGLGSIFLVIKAFEYAQKFEHHLFPGSHFVWPGDAPGHMQIFFSIYFAMTGFHAAHMVIGLIAVAMLAYFSWRGSFTPEAHMPIELVGLYWHFVDIVWVFLYPLLYLIR